MKLMSTIGAVILFIIAGIAIIFGFLFVLGSFSPQGSTGWILPGILIIGFGMACAIGAIVIIYVNNKRAKQEAQANQKITYQLDLSGDVNLETMKCQSCGGTLSSENITMLAGAPVVNCPFCNSSYQLTEEPKW